MRRIARYYGTNILSFFEPAKDNSRLVSPAQRKVLETTKGVRMELLAWGNTAMEPHLFRIKPGGSSGESYTHEGEEFLHILRGDFEIWLDRKEHYLLKPGDSLYFESSTPHRWRNPGRKETWLLWINTPPTFGVYVLGLVMKWLLEQGGLAAVARVNERKAARLYGEIDRTGFYRGTSATAARSTMNVTFRLGTQALESLFIAESTAAGFDGLQGHRAVGGMRASIYNAFPERGVEALVDFMREFERRRG
jgi:mannose-6-phosphate isomerase-like protein (cupin superfamily)